MFLLVLATGGCGFLFSYALLQLGIDRMCLRYPVAVALAYLVFFGLLRCWLSCHLSKEPFATSSDAADALDAALDWSTPLKGHCYGTQSGIDAGSKATSLLDWDEGVLVGIALAALCAGLAVCAYVVWTAPALFAEILVDAAVMTGVYKKLERTDASFWVLGAFRRTWIPALLLALFLGTVGMAMEKIAPEAKSIGPVLHHWAK